MCALVRRDQPAWAVLVDTGELIGFLAVADLVRVRVGEVVCRGRGVTLGEPGAVLGERVIVGGLRRGVGLLAGEPVLERLRRRRLAGGGAVVQRGDRVVGGQCRRVRAVGD